VPDAWKDLVPTEGLSKALESNPAGGGEGLMLFYDRSKTDGTKLREGFRERVLAGGHQHLFECPDEPSKHGKDAPSDGYAKTGSYIEVSVVPLTEESYDVRVTKTDGLQSLMLPERSDCVWGPAAADYCEGGAPAVDGVCLVKGAK
jgi:hypothetical protein